jgi:signal transduction histidine kinase
MPTKDITFFTRIIPKIIITLSMMVLIGWQFNITVLKSIVPGYIAMSPFTALGFIAVAIWQLLCDRLSTKRKGLIYSLLFILALFVLSIGALRIYDIAIDKDYSFNDLFSTNPVRNGRVAPLTAFCFITLGLSMLFTPLIYRRQNLILLFATPVFVVSIISFFGYLIGVNDIFTMQPFTLMALHTSLFFLAITSTFLFQYRQNTFTKIIISKDYGGYIIRGLLPYIVIVPMALGFLRYHGEKLGLYNTGFGVAIIVVGAMLTFIVVVLRQAQHLSKIDKLRKEAENKVFQHAKELELRNKELEQFTHVSHHDLQEPLRKIIMFTDMVKVEAQEKLSDESQLRLKKVSDAAIRMSAALRDVLDFASLGKSEQFVAVNLNQVLAQVQSDLELIISEKGAAITSDQLPTITAIPRQMHQLFYNLVNNALKFSRGGIAPCIRITTRQLNGSQAAEHQDLDKSKTYFAFTIQDNGIGFHQESSQKIFEMFQRLHSKETFAGTGIGLALCKKVVQNHGGKIWAESKEGEGATFNVLLPSS